MDKQTHKVLEWLDQRYRKCNREYVYHAHQPIYGIQDPNSEPNLLTRYLRTFWILNSLICLRGRSLLDVGASEGYQASLARKLLGLQVTCCDLSAEACKRAGEIYSLTAYQANAAELPFADNQFDLVVCSETLEHVPEHTKAISELIRVASKAVVITVPHEPEEEIKENIRNRIIHAHMHSFDLTSFDYLFSYGIRVITTPHISPYWYRVNQVIERVRTAGRAGVFLARLLTTMFIGFDPYLVRSSNGFACILCIILKDSSDRSRNLDRRIRVKEILDHTVPHHFIANKESYQK